MRPKKLSAKAQALQQVALFSACDHEELELAASLVEESRRAAGTELTTQGEVGTQCFVIKSGKVSVELDGEPIALLGPGDAVGEMALLDPAPRSATAVAQTPVELLVLTPRALDRLVSQPSVAKSLLRSLVARLRATEGAPKW